MGGWEKLSETLKFLGFIRTALFQGVNTGCPMFKCRRDTFGIGWKYLEILTFPFLEHHFKFDRSCLERPWGERWNFLWYVDLQMWMKTLAFASANEWVAPLCRDHDVAEGFLYLWFHFSEIGFDWALIEEGDSIQPDLHRNLNWKPELQMLCHLVRNEKALHWKVFKMGYFI